MCEVAVRFDGNNITVNHKNCWHLRGENIKNLVMKAFSWISKDSVKNMKPFSKIFYPNDWGDGKYTVCSDKYTEQIIPCFAFDHWKECRINDYTETCDKISEEGIKKHIFDKLLWIGQLSHHTRKQFVLKYPSNHKREVIALRDHWGHNPAIKTQYISLPDHCKYKYLIDLQGNGYSGRVKFLLHSRRPLFYQARKFHEYWYWSMKPFVHFIPIKEDLSDFDAVFAWAESHPKECNQIAENAYQFAKNNLKREDALTRLKHILYKLGTGEFK